MTGLRVFDNTPLSHFARAGHLDVLGKLVAGHRCVTPQEVATEIMAGIGEHGALARVLTADWLEVVELTEVAQVVSFARFKGQLGGGPERNNGEAAVLAWAEHHGGIAIIDERAGTRIAQRAHIEAHDTLWLIVNALRAGYLTRVEAEHLVDELAETDMSLPVDGAGLFAWAYEQQLLP
jgi:predicted nucleic acid-binding protein